MTRDELLSLGLTPSLARAVADFLKTNIPQAMFVADPTFLVNNEGRMNGWINAANTIGALADPKSVETPELPNLYSEPARK